MYIYLFSFVSGLIGAWLVAKFGSRIGLFDYPSPRSSHYQPVPKSGGIGIALAFVAVAVLVEIPLLLWLPVGFIILLGFIVDRIDILPKWRLLIQFVAALMALLGMKISWQANISGLFLMSLLCFYIVGTTNFYNFMDGINGIAALSGIIAFSLLGYFSIKISADSRISLLLFSLVFACLGFLPFNVPKSKVFMGDVGSTFLGFSFAYMVVYIARNITEFVILSSFLFPFYADELITMCIRIKGREYLTSPHRQHLYQLLANEGQIPHWQVSLGYGVLQLIIALLALFLHRYGLVPVLLMLILAFSGFVAVSVQVRKKLDLVKTGYSH